MEFFSDFISSAVVEIKQQNKKPDGLRKNLQSYIVCFNRPIYTCPGCGSTSFTKRPNSTCHVFAIMKNQPSYCELVRKTYRCNNAGCKTFYNTHDFEDYWFEDKSSFTQEFVLRTLERWLSVKTLSFDQIGEEYGIAGSTADKWSKTLREKFESRFTIPVHDTMIIGSFKDRDGITRGLVASPGLNNSFHVLSFIDEYNQKGFLELFERMDSTSKVPQIFYEGTQDIGESLRPFFSLSKIVSFAETKPDDINILKFRALQRKIIERVNKKDAFDTIVLKFLYDTPSGKCKEAINNALKEAQNKHGISKEKKENAFGFVSFVTARSFYIEEDDARQFNDLPVVSGYYATYNDLI